MTDNQIDNENALKELRELRAELTTARATSTQIQKVDRAIEFLGGGEKQPVLELPDGTGTFSARIEDMARYAHLDRKIDFFIDDLVMHDDFLKGLVDPKLRENNFSQLWEKNLELLLDIHPTQLLASAPVNPLMHDEALKIAENTSVTGLAATTMSVGHKNGSGRIVAASVHIIRNNNSGETLVIGEKISKSLRAEFKKANIQYVDRNAPDSEKEVEKALTRVLGGIKTPYIRDRLTDAFFYRNDKPAFKGETFVETLVSTKIEPLYQKFVVKMK